MVRPTGYPIHSSLADMGDGDTNELGGVFFITNTEAGCDSSCWGGRGRANDARPAWQLVVCCFSYGG